MNTFWTPENTPPQLTPEATEIIQEELRQEGIIQDALTALEQEDHLMAFLDEFGFELNKASSEGPWPARVLNIGAAFALKAYRATGVSESIDTEAIELGNFVAQLHGVPETYVISGHSDPRLVNLTRTIMRSRVFDESYADRKSAGGFEQVGGIGSGCVRHYLQQAIELAS